MGKIVGLAIGALLVLIIGLELAHVSPIAAAGTLLKGSIGSLNAFGGTLRETAPLLVLGLAVFMALRAGLFNIGVEGQFIMGALFGVVVALRVPGPVGIVLGTIAGGIGGALWALPAGLIKALRNGHEVITTIMLNYVALRLTDFLLEGPIKAPTGQEASTADLTPATRLPALVSIGNFQPNTSLVVGVVLAVALAWWLKRTVAGYELEAVGANPIAAKYAGISTPKVQIIAMSASGFIAGIAGAFQVLAYEGRFYQGFSPGYGFDALGVALLAGSSAIGVLPASLLFGILAKGGIALQADGVPKGITSVVLGAMILVSAAIRYRKGVSHD